jgi:hypothetical protein
VTDWLSDYVDVSERLVWFFEHYPEGSLQADILERGDDHVVIKALAYRSPTDARPGSGMASEPIPGRTPYTKDSEVMVGETSAWGRALAAIGAPTKGSIASRQEVANRRSSPAAGPDVVTPSGGAVGDSMSGPEAGGSSAKPAQDPGPGSTSGEGEAPDRGPGEPTTSPGSTKYPLDPTKCSHRFPSGRPLKADEDGNCPRCGTNMIAAIEGTTADLGPA